MALYVMQSMNSVLLPLNKHQPCPDPKRPLPVRRPSIAPVAIALASMSCHGARDTPEKVTEKAATKTQTNTKPKTEPNHWQRAMVYAHIQLQSYC